MMATERHERIIAELRRRRAVSTEDLAVLCDASGETIRRDLAILEGQGQLQRVHGGAARAAERVGDEASFAERTAGAAQAKLRIGQRAASLVRPGQTLIIDVGTTALQAARALPDDFYGTVATCSLLVAAELADRPQIELLVSGGRVRAGDLACSNAQAVAFFSDLRADIAFLGSGGVDATAGLTDYHLDEIATRRVMVANSGRSYILADAAKLTRVAPHRVCGLDAVAGLVTDGVVAPTLKFAVERTGGLVINE
jgi:DeoR family fructose operon transcriptional repressor